MIRKSYKALNFDQFPQYRPILSQKVSRILSLCCTGEHASAVLTLSHPRTHWQETRRDPIVGRRNWQLKRKAPVAKCGWSSWGPAVTNYEIGFIVYIFWTLYKYQTSLESSRHGSGISAGLVTFPNTSNVYMSEGWLAQSCSSRSIHLCFL